MTAPINVKALRRSVDETAERRSVAPRRLQYTVASTVVLQMAPGGAAKGGGAIRQRVDETQARLTTDLDYSRPSDVELDAFADEFAGRLETGWGGFTGRLKRVRKATPDGVPVHYLMDPLPVALEYKGKPYCTVVFELGHCEIESADDPVERLGTDIVQIFAELELPEPQPVTVMRAEHQIVQKIHACTCPTADGTNNARAHDVVDIQILAAVEDLDYGEIGRIAGRLFPYRQRHEWPPTVVVYEEWPGLYAEAIAELTGELVRPDVHEAAAFVNDIIARSHT